jgi:hypothetical protein
MPSPDDVTDLLSHSNVISSPPQKYNSDSGKVEPYEKTDETHQPENKTETSEESGKVEPTTDELKEIISKEVTIQVKFKETDVIFRTTMQISGRWETSIQVYERPMPPVNHETPLYEHDMKRDKGLFLSDLAAILHTNKPHAKILMADVVAEAQKQVEKFNVIVEAYKKIAESRNLAKQEDEDQEQQELASRPKPKMLGLFIPECYDILTGKKYHICGETVLNTATSKGEIIEVPVCKCQAMVMGFPTSHDSDKVLVELAFTKYNPSTKKAEWRTIIVPIEAISTKEGFKKHIIPKGFSVQEININATIEYLEDCITVNAGKEGSAFRSIDVSEITGWTNTRFDTFKLGNRTIRDVNSLPVIEESNCANEEITERVSKRGTPEKHIEVIRPIAHFWRMRYIMYDALASVLLRMLGISPHTSMIVYPSGQGKTTILQLIASLYGNPDEYGEGLLYSGDGSITGVNALMHMYMDLPVLLDESTNSSEKLRKGITYLVGNGAAPLRGNVDQSLRERQNHRSNVYMAAEESMMPPGINDGGNVRMLPFYERFVPAGHGEMIEKAKLGMTQNFGHIIEPFIAKIFTNRAGLRAYFENAKARIAAKTSNDMVKRQATTFAAAQLAGLLLEQVLSEMGLNDPMNPEEIVDNIWQECVGNAEEPMAIKALRLFHSWYLREFNIGGLTHDEKLKYKTKGKIFIWREAIWIDFLHEEFDKELLSKGYTNTKGIYIYWRDVLGILEYETITKNDKEVKRTSARASHYKSTDSDKKEQFHVVRVIVEKMNEVLGLENDADLLDKADKISKMSDEELEELYKNTEFQEELAKIETDHEYIHGKPLRYADW